MGNTIWTCENCNSIIYPNKKYCKRCSKTLILEKAQNASTGGMQIDRFSNHFVDQEFPPTNASLYMNGSRIVRKTLIHSNGFKQVKKWLRPHQVSCGPDEIQYPIALFNNPSPKDVIQGELGTCWFLSALSLVAEKPMLLYNLMLTKQYNPYGAHQIRLCKRGEWKIITIDDYLPCDKHGQLVFSYGHRRQFWVPFMEKALAKMYGSYENIAKGACAEGLQTLTGEPCDVIYLRTTNTTSKTAIHSLYISNPYGDTKNHTWAKILQSKQAGYLMTTLCYNENMSESNFDKFGLLNRHIYSILDVREFHEYPGYSYKLLRLRNPWGHKEWKGAWSDNWTHWPAHVKAQVSVYTKDDGCFWISFDDVLKYFYDITICKVRANWLESRQSSCFYDYSNGTEAFIITVVQAGFHEFEIELFSTGNLHESFDRNADPTADLCLVICRINGSYNQLTCVAFEHSVEYYITTTANLQPGQYLVFATSIKAISPTSGPSNNDVYNSHNYATYNIVVHGQCTFSVTKHRLARDYVADIFYAVAKRQNNFKDELNGLVRSYVIHGSCTHAILIENLSYDMFIRAHLDAKTSGNLESTRLSVETVNCIRPRTREILSFLTPLNYRNGYVIGYKLDLKIVTDGNTLTYPQIVPNYAGLHAIRPI